MIGNANNRAKLDVMNTIYILNFKFNYLRCDLDVCAENVRTLTTIDLRRYNINMNMIRRQNIRTFLHIR